MMEESQKRKNTSTWRLFLRALSQNGALIVLIVMVIILSIAAPAFRRPTSLLLIGLEASFIGIVAVAVGVVGAIWARLGITSDPRRSRRAHRPG